MINIKSIAIVALLTVIDGSAFAQNLVENGSFAEETPLQSIAAMKPYDLDGKGFVLKFDPERWARGWVINGAMDPGTISLVAKEDAIDGDRYLRVQSTGETDIYPVETLPADSYKCSFSAKGEAEGSKTPRITVFAYLYSSEGWLKNIILGHADLEKGWQEYSFEVPVEKISEASSLRIAFGFTGLCDFDNVKIETQH
jgi:hypothetical protein